MPPAKLILSRFDYLSKNKHKGINLLHLKTPDKHPKEMEGKGVNSQKDAPKADQAAETFANIKQEYQQHTFKIQQDPLKLGQAATSRVDTKEEDKKQEEIDMATRVQEIASLKVCTSLPSTGRENIQDGRVVLATAEKNAQNDQRLFDSQISPRSVGKNSPKSRSSGSDSSHPLSRKHMCYKTYSPEDLIAALRTYVKTRKSGKYVSIRHLSRISGIPYATLRDHISGRKSGAARKEIQEVLNDLVRASDLQKEKEEMKMENSPTAVVPVAPVFDANSVMMPYGDLNKLSPTSVVNATAGTSTSLATAGGYKAFLRYYWTDEELGKFQQTLLAVHVNCVQQLAVMENVQKMTGDSNLAASQSFKALMIQSTNTISLGLQERINFLQNNLSLAHAMKAIQNGIVLGFLSTFASAAELMDPQSKSWMCETRFSLLMYNTIVNLSKSQKYSKYLTMEKIQSIDQLRKCWVSDEANINLSVRQLRDKVILSQQSNDLLGVVNLTVQLANLFQRADELRIIILSQTEQVLNDYEIVVPFRCEMIQQIASELPANDLQGTIMNAYTSKLKEMIKF